MSGDEFDEGASEGPVFVEIALEQISDEALHGLIEEFVTRDGTDYGRSELSLEEKAARLMGQLETGGARIVFDPESETVSVVLARDLPGS